MDKEQIGLVKSSVCGLKYDFKELIPEHFQQNLFILWPAGLDNKDYDPYVNSIRVYLNTNNSTAISKRFLL